MPLSPGTRLGHYDGGSALHLVARCMNTAAFGRRCIPPPSLLVGRILPRRGNRTATDRGRLRDLVRLNLKAVRSMLLREDFDPFWRYRSAHWAGLFLDGWCTRVMRSRIDPLKKVARSLRTHRGLLLNWCTARGQMSAGAVEGLNNKAKLTTNKAYGFRTYRCLEVALYHTLGHLPEPEVTHRFY